MTIFNGRYEWDGTKTGDQEPVAWYPGSYDVKLIPLAGGEGVVSLKSVLCLFARTGQGQSIAAQPERFAKRICNDFCLEFSRVLWVEDLLTTDNRYQVINFLDAGQIGGKRFYKPVRRAATAAEVRMIDLALASLACSGGCATDRFSGGGDEGRRAMLVPETMSGGEGD